MALGKDEVDIWFTNVDQRSSDRSGVKIAEMRDSVATRFEEATKDTPAHFLVEPRGAIESLTTDTRDTSGAIVSLPGWQTKHDLLASLGGQLVAIEANSPRVYNDGEDPYWVKYPDVVQTNVLTEDTVIGGYGTETTPDNAIIDGVQACVLTQISDSTHSLTLGFRELTGKQWLVPPFVIASHADPIVGHVVAQDGRFWLVYNDNSIDEFQIKVYDTKGVLLDSDHFGKLDTSKSPGFWDITASVSDDEKVVIAQPGGDTTDPTVDVNVVTTSARWDDLTDAIVLDTVTQAAMRCNGPVAWAKNANVLDSHDYLETRWEDAELVRGFDVYRLDDEQAILDTWSIVGAESDELDAFTGYVPAFDPSHSYLYLVAGYSEPDSDEGPRFNPQERYVATYRFDLVSDVVTLQKKSISHALATRPFANGTTWQVATFYQSGQGYQTPAPITPDITLGDYFIGSGTQKLIVNQGDSVRGSPSTLASVSGIGPTDPGASVGIAGGDTVAAIAASGISGIPDGTPLLEWTFANLVSGSSPYGGFLTPDTSSISTANHGWFVVQKVSTHVFRTLATSAQGFTTPGGTFSATGTVSIIASAVYNFADLSGVIPPELRSYYVGGTLTVTGNAVSGNNVTDAPIYAITYKAQIPNTNADLDAVFVPLTTQSFSFTGFTATITPVGTNIWFLGSNAVSGKMVGDFLIVTDDENPTNNGAFEVTDVFGPFGEFETGNETQLISEVFAAGKVPEISLQLGPTNVAYTFFIADLADDLAINAQRFMGATVDFTSGNFPDNTGTYRIIGWGTDLDGTIYAERVVQSDQQSTQDLVNGEDSVIIYLDQSAGVPFQPTYFLVPTEGSRAIVGCFDRLQAYNDWRIDGVNTLNGHLSRVVDDESGAVFLLTTRQQPASLVNGVTVTPANTVGVKCWTLAPTNGTSTQRLIPGPLAVSFEADSFPEDGFQLAPEALWFVSQAEADPGQLALIKKQRYIYQLLDEAIDQEGKRVFSPLSPPLQVALTGENNQVTLGGVLPAPWNNTPTPIAGETGVTNRTQIAITIGRTSVRNGVTTVLRYRLTSNLNPNQVAPTSDDNPSGFTFDGDRHITFTFVDQNADQVIQSNDSLPVGLPRFGAGPFSHGCTWQGRNYLIGPDGSVGFSTADTEGTRQSYNPLFRIAPPEGDRIVRVVPLERYLVGLGSKSAYWLPSVQMPNSLGQGGAIPAWIKTKFTNGCNGPAIQSGAGVVYSSTAGGLWVVTEDLSNEIWSIDVRYFDDNPPTSMAIDGKQRLICSLADGKIAVYDFVSRLWSKWNPAANTSIIAVHGGMLVTGTPSRINRQTTGVVDVDGVAEIPIRMYGKFIGLSFGGVRHFARWKRAQLGGEYRGPHNVIAVTIYPDDYPSDPTTRTVTALADSPYLYSFSPGHGKSSMFELELQVDFTGVESPGASAAWEVLACEVGLDHGIKSTPANKRFT